jgi:hypothetical protein
MAPFKINCFAAICFLLLPLLTRAQSSVNHSDSSIKKQKMENKIVIGKIMVPKNSIEDFRKQNVTSGFLRTLPGFVKGETYELVDDSGNLSMITVTTWLNEQSYNNAQQSLKEYYKSIKFNPQAFREKLKIVAEHGLYSLKN